jgi:hypothetical protein
MERNYRRMEWNYCRMDIRRKLDGRPIIKKSGEENSQNIP